MLAVCSPSQSSMAGSGGPNRHYWQLNSSHPAPSPHPGAHSWSSGFEDLGHIPPQPQTTYEHYDQSLNGSLAYRPRIDEYPYSGIHHAMTSPPHPMSSTPTSGPVSGHPDYPEDHNFETASDGRLEMAQDDVDAIIRNKRKVRDPKACYACHRRKVKCNRELPCDSCVKRDHPELCSYERPTKKRRIAMGTHFPRDGSEALDVKDPSLQSGPNVTVPKEQWERVNKELQALKEQLSNGHSTTHDAQGEDDARESGPQEEEREGIHAASNQLGTMHLGSRSVLAYMMGLGRDQSTHDSASALLNDNILPKLGLDNDSVTYPFVDLWSADNGMKDIDGLCSAIPSDDLCRQFFYSYRDIACTIYPVVPECDAFEASLEFMLANRAKAAREGVPLNPNNPMGISLTYLALVFAVLASGAQSTRIGAKERELTSQVYICCSYQALRMGNFLTNPSLETIQALLIITNVLSYNMNPGVAYIFLGLVVRMAFSMGLQTNQSGFSDHESWLRRRTWWAIAWQDSHFSVSYDRPSASALCGPDLPYSPGSAPGSRSYAETMFGIIRLTQDIIRDRILKPNMRMTWNHIQRLRDGVIQLVSEGTPHLRKSSACGDDPRKHMERLALQLHSSYMISELCRPALKEGADEGTPSATPSGSPAAQGQRRKTSRTSSRSPPVDPDLPQRLRSDCLRGLERCVAAYVELCDRSRFAARSWVGIQRALSAAFLLGTVPEANQEPHTMALLRSLEECIAARTTDDPGFDASQTAGDLTTPNTANPAAEQLDTVWARSMTKSLAALQKLNAALAKHKGATGPRDHPNATPYIDGHSMRSTTSHPPLHLTMPQQHPIVKQEAPYSPAVGNGIVVMPQGGLPTSGAQPMAHMDLNGAPHSAVSAASGDWGYDRLHERANGFVQAPMWQ